MITLIVGIIIILIGICVLILAINSDNEAGIAIGLFFILTPIFMIIFSLSYGTSIYKQHVDLAKKEHIEYLLENKPDLYSIQQAVQFNEDVQFGNNYWCRFNIEDRSEYLINIDSYLEKNNEV